MVAMHLLMTGMANCDVCGWAGPVINPAHWSTVPLINEIC
jgi:hypothetical protein